MEQHVDIVGAIGVILLESGAEIYRVEETMVKIGESISGVIETQSFVTPTGIMLSLAENGVVNTKVIRVHQRGINLQRISEINQLSRRCVQGNMSDEDIINEVKRIKNLSTYSTELILIAAGLSAFGFALFFNATILEAICAGIIGIICKGCYELFAKIKLHHFLNQVISAALIAFLSSLLCYYQTNLNKDIMIVSGIMLFVPGLAITNAIRDMLAGDYVSFLGRSVEAVMIAVAIAFGVVSMLICLQQLLGGF